MNLIAFKMSILCQHGLQIVVPKKKAKTIFTIEQENRKYELAIHFNAQVSIVTSFRLWLKKVTVQCEQNKRFNLFRGKLSDDQQPATLTSIIQVCMLMPFLQ